MLTTTIGAYPKPDEVPIRDWFQTDGGTDTAEPTAGYAETVRRYGERLEAILDRATVAGGARAGRPRHRHPDRRRDPARELHPLPLPASRRDRLRAAQREADARPLPGAAADHHRAGQAARQPFLVRDWQIAQSATRKPVKITVPGPLTIGDSVADDFYRTTRARAAPRSPMR